MQSGNQQIPEWFKFWKYDCHQYTSSLLSACLARWMMIYRALLRKGTTIKSIVIIFFQLNDVLIIQNIFSFVCRLQQRGGVWKTRKSRIPNLEPEQQWGQTGKHWKHLKKVSDCRSSDWVYGDCHYSENLTAFVNRWYFSDTSYQGCVFYSLL